ncbi:MAG: aminomethyl-transferring glycine dehydrogenase subunit GcvPB [candidate division KSB1 bacterium]|nr:aminomethyl-transferring glycine dehydrogenase subunit GcvPB [candidate division KSB1 bacterium]MDZ7336589.1 aminomethyl-transferring glycine dehydrogenase subunit GcvPB [candidate division KSB1 bacterium]MDZ7358880.1 aminomethyl-transferring glycine dehydrogenase subunit GcvPB [candidate division KSB1 bacterium]MDZ7375755.1 aminomethyl-transferring glycine dehydrogenase subunit GcvPB [candidate division KSB1 bacterium]MDZ7401340.1 aminomethyl-transferring glycine dehydrogenase subunit GcvPB
MAKLLFELSVENRKGFSLGSATVPERKLAAMIPPKFLRQQPARLPQLSENEVVRHFIALSTMNYHIDKGFYPLGSCTMKYNPKINEQVASSSCLKDLHPMQHERLTQGALALMDELSQFLCEIAGMKAVTLQPAAGAHGELTGLMLIRAYHENLGDPRENILIPDSAHGTNPASVTISGYQAVKIKSNERGLVDLEDLKRHLNDKTAALMLTNPNTLGLFETQLAKINELLHEVGALLYMDGANLNALLGIVRPGDVGVDVLHFNLHKTFSTPHGGGGPGAGPVGVSEKLVDFLPVPRIVKNGSEYHLKDDFPKSIGRIHSFYGNFAVMVRAYTYIRMLGAAGLKRVSQNAIINANYLMKLLSDHFELPYPGPAMHEFVLSGSRQKDKGVSTADMAKRLLDFGFHAPTIYFPLIVREAIMIEPTETESKETLDQFAECMIQIAREAETNPDLVRNAPHTTPVARLDEARAVKQPDLRYQPH